MLLLLAACTPPEAALDSATDDAEVVDAVPVCFSSFRADVREGPNAGAAVVGTLAMTDAPEAVFFDGTSTLEVPMTLSGEDVTLDFVLDAGTVHGTGTMPFAIEECVGEMDGPLTGPGEGDTGDWLGKSSVVPMPDGAPEPNKEPVPGCTYSLQDGTLVVLGAFDGTVAGMVMEPGAKDPVGLVGTASGSVIDVKLSDGSEGRIEMQSSVEECSGGFTGTLGLTEATATVDPAGYTDIKDVDFVFLEPLDIESDSAYILELSRE